MMPTPITTAARPRPFPVGPTAWPDLVPPPHHAVYRFFTAEGELLYVGVSWNPAGRWETHRRVAAWWLFAAVVVVDVYDTEATALEVERYWIAAAAPLHNVRSARR
jgi:hypothetical protein